MAEKAINEPQKDIRYYSHIPTTKPEIHYYDPVPEKVKKVIAVNFMKYLLEGEIYEVPVIQIDSGVHIIGGASLHDGLEDVVVHALPNHARDYRAIVLEQDIGKAYLVYNEGKDAQIIGYAQIDSGANREQEIREVSLLTRDAILQLMNNNRQTKKAL